MEEKYLTRLITSGSRSVTGPRNKFVLQIVELFKYAAVKIY